MKLYDYWRSSAAYRVRIALNLKGLSYTHECVHLVRDGGENLKPAYRALNPQGKVPTLELDDGTALAQSMAIIEYLDETHPDPALLPKDPVSRAQARAFALAVACEIHPLNNIGVLKHLEATFGAEGKAKVAWMAHWMGEGFAALEDGLARRDWQGPFLFGDAPGIAEIFLVPQFYNARRWGIDLSAYPLLVKADEAAHGVKAFQDAAPEAQPDAE
jgi:maleylpyruvate isomerase